MKLFAYNDKLNSPHEFGSFTVVARKLNEQFEKMGILGDEKDEQCFVIFPECLDVQRKWNRHVPLLACEYSRALPIISSTLKTYSPPIIAISEFAQKNLINSGLNNVHFAHLGSDSEVWYKTHHIKFDTFTYLTVNSSNERSGFEKLIPAFIEFSKDKNVQLIIKDGKNPRFSAYIKTLNHPKIIYVDEIMDEKDLRILYNRSHLFIYANNTTSFGMTPLDAALCGTPAIVTLGSALKEFIPRWTQLEEIRTKFGQIIPQDIDDWQSIGLNTFPKSWLDIYGGPIYGEKVLENTILSALEFSFKNLEDYNIINHHHAEYIKKNLSWEKTAKSIVEILKKYE